MNPQEQHEYDDAVQKGHTLFLNDRPVERQETLDIANAVMKKNPALIIVGVDRRMRKPTEHGHYDVYRAIEFGFKEAPNQIVGSVGYEYDQYFVTSRLIENAKFSRWSGRDFNTRKSKHMNKIVKEAVGALLPTQFDEVVAESGNMFLKRISEIRDNAVHGMRSALNNTNSYLRDELFHMVATGYVPKNPQFKRAMEYVVASKDEYERNEKYNPERTFVWIKPKEVLYKVGGDENIRSVASTDDLPEHIRGKLFVLMVSDKNNFIDEVGMKADDNKFWVIL
jgi:hypothetical protein